MPKKTTVIIFPILCFLFSCSSTYIEKQILNDFINEQNKNGRTIKVIVDMSYPRTKSLDYYVMAYEDRNIPLLARASCSCHVNKQINPVD